MALPEVTDVVINPEDNSLKIMLSDGKAIINFTDTLHQRLRQAADGAERQSILAHYVRGAVMTPASSATKERKVASAILPVVRSTDMLSQPNSGDLVTLPLVGDIATLFVFDFPESMAYVTATDADALSLTTEGLLELALGNFAARSAQGHIEGNPDTYCYFVLDENYESSLLLDRAFWVKLAEEMGSVVAAVPTRSLLMFADGSRPDAKAKLRAMAVTAEATWPNPISNQLLLWRDGGWVITQ